MTYDILNEKKRSAEQGIQYATLCVKNGERSESILEFACIEKMGTKLGILEAKIERRFLDYIPVYAFCFLNLVSVLFIFFKLTIFQKNCKYNVAH